MYIPLRHMKRWVPTTLWQKNSDLFFYSDSVRPLFIRHPDSTPLRLSLASSKHLHFTFIVNVAEGSRQRRCRLRRLNQPLGEGSRGTYGTHNYKSDHGNTYAVTSARGGSAYFFGRGSSNGPRQTNVPRLRSRDSSLALSSRHHRSE